MALTRQQLPTTVLLAVFTLFAACRDRGGDIEQPPEKPLAEAQPAEPPRPTAGEGRALLGDVISAEVLEKALQNSVDQWFGVYIGQKKFGYAHVAMRATADGEKGRYLTELEFRAKMSTPDGQYELGMVESRFYGPAPSFGLVELHFEESLPQTTRVLVIKFSDKETSVEERLDGKLTRTSKGSPSADNAASSALAMGMINDSLTTGLVIGYVEYDHDKGKDQPSTVTVKNRDRRKIAGVDVQTVMIETLEVGQTTPFKTVMADGLVLYSEASDFSLRHESKDVAKSDVVGLDLVGSALEIDRDLGDAETIRRLDLVFEAPEEMVLPNTPYQVVTKSMPRTSRVTLRSVPGDTITAEERKEALADTSEVDYRKPAMQRVARELTAGAKTDFEKLSRINRWVFEQLEKTYSSDLFSASQVLERKIGDCTEHTLLFLALARASGIAAREVSGLVYMGDEYRRFGFHAWVEAEVDGRWHPMDPTWGETTVNATHIALALGSDNGEWAMHMASLEIRIAADAKIER